MIQWKSKTIQDMRQKISQGHLHKVIHDTFMKE